MKRILLSIFLLIYFFSAKASQASSLKYDFKIGDEFVVKVRSYGQGYNKSLFGGYFFSRLNPTSLDFYFKFNPIDKKNDQTEMEVTIQRIVRWRNNRCYDTQIQESPVSSYEMVFKELINKSFKLYIKDDGTVSNVVGIEEIVNDIIKRKFSESFKQFYTNSFRKALSDMQFKTLVQYAFPNLSKAKSINNLSGDSELQAVVFKSDTSLFNSDFFVLNEGDVEFLHPLEADTILFSTQKGRFIGGNLKGSSEFCNDALTGLKVMTANGDFMILGRAATIINYDQKNAGIPTNKVILKGKIQGKFPSVGSLYMQPRYPDHDAFQKKELKIDENGQFSITFDLHRPMDLTLRIGDVNSESSFAKDIFLEPGDELEINIENNSGGALWSYSGESALKFQLLDRINNEIKPYEIAEDENLDLLISKMWKDVHSLEKYIKNQPLSVWARKYLKTNLYVNVYYGIIGSDYRPRYSEKSIQELHIQWMEQIESTFYIYPDINSTRAFIDRYINIKDKELQRFSWKHDATEVQYNISKVLLEDELLYYSAGKQIHNAIQKADYDLAERLLNEYQVMFPSTELTDIFARQLGDCAVMKEGKKAPDFTLLNRDNKKIKLSDYQGQWVYMLFAETSEDINQSNLKYLQLLKDSVNGAFTTLLIVTDKDVTNQLLNEIRKYYSGDLLLNPDWNNAETQKYKVTKASSAFLINPDGEFEFLWDKHLSSDITLTPDRFVNYARVISDYISLKQPEFAKSNLGVSYFYWSLALMLLISGSIWFYHIIRQKQLKQDEARKREKVQLELKAIRSQLNPHFMFNTLNSIQHLVGDGRNEEACSYISEFSGLMRQVLNNSDKALTSLNEEIKALETYLKLEALRFGFDYKIEVDPTIASDLIEIPGLMVQPFVENAVIHGVSRLKKKGRIVVSFQLEGGKLICSVDDNGGGYSEVKNSLLSGQGIALSKRRLQVLKESYQLEIDVAIKNKRDLDPDKNGTLVEITYELNDV